MRGVGSDLPHMNLKSLERLSSGGCKPKGHMTSPLADSLSTQQCDPSVLLIMAPVVSVILLFSLERKNSSCRVSPMVRGFPRNYPSFCRSMNGVTKNPKSRPRGT